MHLSTFLGASIGPLLTLANPAPILPPVGNPPPPAVTIPAAVPTPLASDAASAIGALPVSIPVAMPTVLPSSPTTIPSDLIPNLGLPPSEVLENVEAYIEILGVVITLLSPEYVFGGDGDQGSDNEGGEDGGEEDFAKPGIDGRLITTLIQTAAGLLSLVPAPMPSP